MEVDFVVLVFPRRAAAVTTVACDGDLAMVAPFLAVGALQQFRVARRAPPVALNASTRIAQRHLFQFVLAIHVFSHGVGFFFLFGRSMQATKFVSVRIAHVDQVELASRAFAPAGWVFTRRAAVGNACCVEGIGLLGRRHGETDRAAIGAGSALTIDGRGDGK